MKKLVADSDGIFRIPPFYYLHILDHSSNITRILTGPTTFVRQDNEEVIEGPDKMVIVPPNHFCVVRHPVLRDTQGNVVLESSGQVKLRHGDLEVRLTRDPFPLYPGEKLDEHVTKLRAVPRDTALRLQALRDFQEGDVERLALDQWLFEGPGTYIPRVEVEIVETLRATIIPHVPHTALRLRAIQDCKDKEGGDRVYGEEWLVSKPGAYLPGPHEEILGTLSAYKLNDKMALHVQAIQTFTDRFGKKRKAGEKWLVTLKDTVSYIPDVFETVVETVAVTVLTNRQYCVILDPVGTDGKNQLGSKKLVKGEKEFFMNPGETLEGGDVQDICILLEDEAVVLRAILPFKDDAVQRNPGDMWMVRGPREFCPTVEMEIVSRRKAIPLDVNEGLYIRNVKTGKIRAVIGTTYIPDQDELLHAKELPEYIEKLLSDAQNPLVGREKLRGGIEVKGAVKPRDKTRVVTYQVPHNAAVQVFDYKTKVSRVVFGPDLIMLGPDEHFTQLSLSGGQPKRPNVIRTLDLSLGPDFMTDIFTVETCDHARLSLQLCYNWHFEVPDENSANFAREAGSLFSVPDFVGDACKSIASRIRGVVASVPFDDFHKHSAQVISNAIIGKKDALYFPANRLRITNIDIQSVEPVDQRTRDSLMKSVQLAIEITTNSQEATARHEAERLDQGARGRLERQKLSDEAEAEKARKDLLELQATSAAVESTGQAIAEAQSRAESLKIEGEAAVEQAKLAAEADNITAQAELERLVAARNSELDYLKNCNNLEVTKKQKMANIETERFSTMVNSLGAPNIAKIATSGTDSQVRMLEALGLKSTLITDGSTPLNLFNTAQGLIGALPAQVSAPFPEIKSAHSLVAKHVTKERWDKLAGHKTRTSGFTLDQAIACAVKLDNQHCGIYAGDWDSYKDFAEVFDPIIQEYHGISPDSKHTSDMDVSKIVGNVNPDAPIKSTRIRVGRSIDGYGLSPGITQKQRLAVEKLFKSASRKLAGDLSGTYFPLTGMDEAIRRQLVHDHFLFMSGDPNLKVSGMERDWPEGRGIFHNKDKTFLVWVNEEDQFRIISMQKGGDVKGVFARLVRGIEAVGKSVKAESGKDFMLDEKYGYVHSCPTNLGTGMRASVHIDLPGWTAYGVDKLKARCEKLALQPRGTRGESGGQTGVTYDISNKHRLGYSEVQLVQTMIDGVNALYEEDVELQAALKTSTRI